MLRTTSLPRGKERIRDMAGRRREISSEAVIGAAPGRVDCPPRSRIEAPEVRKVAIVWGRVADV